MKDFLGQDISVGDVIVYPNSRSPVKLSKSRVISIHDDALRIKRADGTVKPLRRVDRVIVVNALLDTANASL